MSEILLVDQKKSFLGRLPIWNDPEDLELEINSYFEDCKINDKKPSMSGLAYALGIDRDTILRYGKKERFYGTIKRARDYVAATTEDCLLNSKSGTPIIGAIFALKNNFGWVDKQEIQSNVTHDLSTDLKQLFPQRELLSGTDNQKTVTDNKIEQENLPQPRKPE